MPKKSQQPLADFLADVCQPGRCDCAARKKREEDLRKQRQGVDFADVVMPEQPDSGSNSKGRRRRNNDQGRLMRELYGSRSGRQEATRQPVSRPVRPGGNPWQPDADRVLVGRDYYDRSGPQLVTNLRRSRKRRQR